MRTRFVVSALVLTFFLAPCSAAAQGLKLAVGDVGLGIGDVPRLDGIRLNFRDRELRLVRGINATIWTPYNEADGVVEGIALGVPLTGAAEIRGLALGAGVGADRTFSGIGVAAIGMGAGEGMRGIGISGIGMGSGGEMEGVWVGGIGVGAGGDVTGVMLGGIGAGAGGNLKGLAAGGIGIGASGDVTGIVLGGVGVGAGGDLTGIAVGGVGIGAGGDVTGLMIGGVGAGAGGTLKGLAIAGIGAGAPRVEGVLLTGVAAGGREVLGLSIAPAWFKIEDGGVLRGVSVSAFNDLRRAEQRGLVIGLLNIAEELHGLQIGLINIARNKERFSVLPIANWHR